MSSLPLATIQSIASAIKADDVSLLQRHLSVLHLPISPHGSTALYFAAATGKLKCVQFMCQSLPPHVIRAKNHEGGTCLHEACAFGHVSVVKFLLEKDPELPRIPRHDGATPFALACALGQLPIVSLLLDKDPGLIRFVANNHMQYGRSVFCM